MDLFPRCCVVAVDHKWYTLSPILPALVSNNGRVWITNWPGRFQAKLDTPESYKTCFDWSLKRPCFGGGCFVSPPKIEKHSQVPGTYGHEHYGPGGFET